MTGHGSPAYWQERRQAWAGRWFDRWLPSLLSDQQLPVDHGSFAYLVRDLGTGARQRLIRHLTNEVAVLAPPALVPIWEEDLLRSGITTAGVMSFHTAARRQEIPSPAKTLVVEATVSDRTKAAKGLYKLASDFPGRVISVAHFLLHSDGIPREASTALRMVGPKPPVTVVWEPPIDTEALQRAAKAIHA